MKSFRVLLSAISLFLILCSNISNAQVTTTAGTDFWLGFIDFFDNSVTVDVRISSSIGATGTVAVPGQAWSTPFTVAANATTTINIPIATVYLGNSEVVTAKGIHITSNNTVSVMATTNTAVRSETALVLSTPVLNTQYYVASYAPGSFNFTSEFLVVATANGTTVDITPSVQTAGGKAAGATFSVNLNAGQVYQVKAGNSGTKDLTGSKITVSASTPCKTIAVFSGMNDGYVPASTCATADPLFEEMNPVSVWGTDYVVAPYYTSTGSQVRIIASQATTSVSIDGGAPIILNAGQFNEQSFNGSAHCITADKPIEVVQYMKGNACSGATPNKGDPSMMILNSNNQMTTQTVFSPFNTGMASRSVNVIMQTANVAQLTLDGVAVGAGAFTAVPCAGYSYARLNITNAFHTLAAAGGFVAYLYGYGSGDDGYSNPLGWSINLPSPITPTITGTTSICTGANTTLNAGSGYTSYSWAPGGQTSSVITVTPASTSTYTVTVTTACATGTGTVQVTVAPCGPTVTTTNNSVCPGACNNITATGSGGTGPYTYSWSPGAGTGSSFNVCPASNTTYTVITTDNVGGTASSTATVTVNPAPTVNITGTTTICNGTGTTLTASGGGTYVWNTSATTTSITVSPTSNTTYTVTATTSGCTGSKTVAVTVNNNPVPTISGTTNICTGQSTTLTATAGGTYSWSPGGQTTAAITVTPATGNTTYTVTVTTGGCTGATTVVVTVASGLVPTITGTTTICPGASTILTGTGGGTYAWSTGETTTAITVSPSGPTSYSVTVTNGSCSGTATVQVSITTPPSPTITGTTTICNGSSTTLTATSGGTYSWNTGATTTSITVSPTNNTTYTVTVTTTGCTGSATAAVTVIPNPTITVSPVSICAGGNATLTATGGTGYLWSTSETTSAISVSPATTSSYTVTVTNSGCSSSAVASVTVGSSIVPVITGTTTICNGASTILSTSGGGTYLWNDGTTNTSITVSPITPTSYSVTVTNGSCSGTASVQVTVINNPTPLISGNNSVCTGTGTTLTASGGGTYAWDNGATTTSITVSPAVQTTYTVTANTSGCTGQTTVVVSITPPPNPTITGTTAICNGGSTTLTATAGGTYTWSNGATTTAITVSPVSTTTYTVIVTTGCSASATVAVTVQANLVPSITGTTTICNGASTTLSTSGGGTYLWNDGTTNSSITVSPTTNTTYSVTVTNGTCSGTAVQPVTVNQNPSPAIAGNKTICSGNSTTLTANAGGTYSWNTTATTASITVNPLSNTTYTVIVTTLGCTGSATAGVTVNPVPNPSLTGTNSICSGQSTILTSSTAGPYSWNTGETTNTITVSPNTTTTYSVSVTQNNCTGTSVITVTVIPPVTASITGNDICAGQNTTLTASGGTTYLWNTGSTTNPLTDSPTTTTTYTVFVSTGLCADTATYVVNVNPLPTATASGSTTISYGNSTPIIATGGGTYSWSPITGLSCTDCANPTATPTATTQYCVTVTQSGCADSACVTITIDTKCGDNGELYVPNGFSPNADGQNDVLYVRGGGATSIVWFIYDRWGEKVFETTDPKQGWDGTYKGKQLDPAVFVYYLKVTCFSGDEITQKGNVAIIK